MKRIIATGIFMTFLSACQYESTFVGSYNGTSATMSALSKNINRYCIALSLKSETETRNAFISASDVFDPSDLLKTKAFQTKDSSCGSNSEEYLEGDRSTTLLNTSLVVVVQRMSKYECRKYTYRKYNYREHVSIAFKNKITDETMGAFTGTSPAMEYIDRVHPVSVSGTYTCSYNDISIGRVH